MKGKVPSKFVQVNEEFLLSLKMPRRRSSIKKKVKPLTDDEMEQISSVFHQYETGVRSGRIRSVVIVHLSESQINPFGKDHLL